LVEQHEPNGATTVSLSLLPTRPIAASTVNAGTEMAAGGAHSASSRPSSVNLLPVAPITDSMAKEESAEVLSADFVTAMPSPSTSSNPLLPVPYPRRRILRSASSSSRSEPKLRSPYGMRLGGAISARAWGLDAARASEAERKSHFALRERLCEDAKTRSRTLPKPAERAGPPAAGEEAGAVLDDDVEEEENAVVAAEAEAEAGPRPRPATSAAVAGLASSTLMQST
jgi:hypothetical protein